MRLICPNCDAQYEVDDAAIPASGRDVQCSNCGHAWFQLHPDEIAAMEQEDEVFEPLPDSPPPPPPISPEPEVDLDFPPETEEEPVPAPEPAPAFRRVIDDNVLAVLREEAEREKAVRQTEAPVAIEVQQDLGLPPPPPAPVLPSIVAARERFRDLSIETDDEIESDRPAKPASRRELLPDIEEINSTLRASSERRADDDDEMPMLPPPVEESRQGFRSGFVLMMIVAVVLWTTYAMAPRITEQFPASAGAMKTYVGAVDKARVGVDAALKSATEQLRNLSGDKG